MKKTDYAIKSFRSSKEWRQWLDKHCGDTDGLWLRIYKKASAIQSVTYAEALDHALCYGWIDGQVKRYDDESYIQKFTPRRKASLWSKRNIEYVARLSEAGLMTPAGKAEVERAQQDGRWAAAYDKPSEIKESEEFLIALESNPRARINYEQLSKSSRYSVLWSLQTAKTEATRKRRMDVFIAKLHISDKM